MLLAASTTTTTEDGLEGSTWFTGFRRTDSLTQWVRQKARTGVVYLNWGLPQPVYPTNSQLAFSVARPFKKHDAQRMKAYRPPQTPHGYYRHQIPAPNPDLCGSTKLA